LSVDGSNSASALDATRKGPWRREIALIGGSVRAAAQSAQAAGLLVTGFDRFADQDTRHACHRHFLIEPFLDGPGSPSSLIESIAAIGRQMPLIPVGGLGGLDRLLARLPLMEPWPGQREAIAMIRQPEFLVELCRDSRFRVPQMMARSAANDIIDITLPRARRRWLCKNSGSSGGLGTSWYEPGSTRTLDDGEYLQQWVEGRLFGATLISNGAETLLLGVCRSRFTRKGRYPFVYCGSIGPIRVPEALQASLHELGSKLATRSGLRGLFNLDFVCGPDNQHWLLEVNPRWSGSSELIERHLRRKSSIESLLALAIESLDGSPLDRCLGDLAQMDSEDPLYDKRIVFARRDLTLDHDRLTRWLNENESLHDIPPPDRRIGRGEPVCTLITRCVSSRQQKEQASSENESSPMRRHRALIGHLSGAVKHPPASLP
jgi:predicted ATP-grasp superfamily ATP-dependent carboligase